MTEAVRGEGGRLFNALGERFMECYDPVRLELSSRDRVALANYTEIAEGRGGPHGGVFLDITHRDREYIVDKLPRMYRQFIEWEMLDISRDPMEVAPRPITAWVESWLIRNTRHRGWRAVCGGRMRRRYAWGESTRRQFARRDADLGSPGGRSGRDPCARVRNPCALTSGDRRRGRRVGCTDETRIRTREAAAAAPP